ncbi:hypothetical protein N0V87_006978 [Didymella glomerata]|uniref:Uncharacterized protein n=1 Tax=Didymella glomerata TaxID=749621 RepID=A0A9W8WVP7_9PLEO|nr:hypothetical protein N0V87_006978 [Didymella glomerata]
MTSRSGAFFGIPVWAYSDGIKATYYFSSNLGTDLTACASPISSGGKKSPENNFRTPFCYATASPEPTSSTRRANVQLEHVRELARERLALLVKFVFLLTNRIDNLPNKVGNDMLLHSKDLCIHVQRQKKIVKESSRKAASHFQDARRSSISARSTTIDADNTEGDTADAGGSQIMISEHSQTTGVAARNSKRVESDDDDLMAAATSSNAPKRMRTLQSEHTSSRLQSNFNSLVQQCKSELTNEVATQEQMSQTEIIQLRGEMIVNLEVEVKEWKEKFEKLNNKVQIFMKDD